MIRTLTSGDLLRRIIVLFCRDREWGAAMTAAMDIELRPVRRNLRANHLPFQTFVPLRAGAGVRSVVDGPRFLKWRLLCSRAGTVHCYRAR